jgi:hypothetical protein
MSWQWFLLNAVSCPKLGFLPRGYIKRRRRPFSSLKGIARPIEFVLIPEDDLTRMANSQKMIYRE